MEHKCEKKDYKISGIQEETKSQKKREMQEKEGIPSRKLSPSPLYPESLNLLLVLVMPAARNYGPRFIKANHPQICGENVCEYGEERVGALERASSAYFFRSQSFILFPHCLTSYSNCVLRA